MRHDIRNRIRITRDNAVVLDGRRTGIYVRQGAYQGTTDDRLGRWYTVREGDDFFRPWGAGCASRMDAAESAVMPSMCDY